MNRKAAISAYKVNDQRSLLHEFAW